MLDFDKFKQKFLLQPIEKKKQECENEEEREESGSGANEESRQSKRRRRKKQQRGSFLEQADEYRDGKTLDCHRQQNLANLPSQIGNLTFLTRLWVYGNGFENLFSNSEDKPEQTHSCPLCKLTNLTSLEVYENKLSSLPSCISALVNVSFPPTDPRS